MYTVLIQSRKALDSYRQFEPIMSVSGGSDALDVCAWSMDADTMDTAVPELMGKVRRIKKWRAVVIQAELPGDGDRFRIRNNNPFDYEEEDPEEKPEETGKPAAERKGDFPFLFQRRENGSVTEEIRPSSFPMVKIAQLLGGIPAQSPDFVPAYRDKEHAPTDEDESGVPSSPAGSGDAPGGEEGPADRKTGPSPSVHSELVFIQRQKDEELRRYKQMCDEWNRKNAFTGNPPSEIILIRLRRVSFLGLENELGGSWHGLEDGVPGEPMFWERMGYPTCCRFLTFDVDTRGILQEEGDMFRFWNAVLLLSGNRIDPNVLRPYRLHRLDVRLNTEKLHDRIQTAANCLSYAQYKSEQARLQALPSEQPAEGAAAMPDIEVSVELDLQAAMARDSIASAGEDDVPADGKAPDRYSIRAPEKPGLLCADRAAALLEWENYTQNISEGWIRQQIVIRRMIGAAAEKARSAGTVAEEDTRELTSEQQEDLRDRLEICYSQIVSSQKQLPFFGKKYLFSQLEPLNRQIRTLIGRRITHSSAAGVLALLLGACAIGLGAAFYRSASPWYYPAIIAAAVLILALTCFGVGLALQRSALYSLMREYFNEYLKKLEEQKKGIALLEKFISLVGTSMRGNSLLYNLEKLTKRHIEAIENTDRRSKAMARFQETLSKWSDALQLGVDFDDRKAIEEMIEHRFAVDFDRLFTLETVRNHRVPVNGSSPSVLSPYDYVESLLIEHEEVYNER